MVAVSIENRDLFLLFQGGKVCCKATVTSVPLLKGKLFVLGRKHRRMALETLVSAKL